MRFSVSRKAWYSTSGTLSFLEYNLEFWTNTSSIILMPKWNHFRSSFPCKILYLTFFYFTKWNLSTSGGKLQWLIAFREVLEDITEPHTLIQKTSQNLIQMSCWWDKNNAAASSLLQVKKIIKLLPEKNDAKCFSTISLIIKYVLKNSQWHEYGRWMPITQLTIFCKHILTFI